MKLDALDHPKTFSLSAGLNCELPTTIGYLELLWKFVGQHSAQGNIGKWDDGAIARACYWPGEPEIFIKALVNSGYLEETEEHRLIVHDWEEHAQSWVRAKLKKLGLEFIHKDIQENLLIEGTTEGSTEQTTEGSYKREEKSSREKNRKEGNGEDKNTVAQSIEIVFNSWKQYCNHPRSNLDDKRKKLITDALKTGYTEDQLIEAIRGCTNTPHNMGINDRDEKYDGLHVILKNADQIDRFINNFHTPPTPKNEAERRFISNITAATQAINELDGEEHGIH